MMEQQQWPVQEEYLIVCDDQQQQPAVNVYGIPVVCAWCQDYVPGSTSTICKECEEKYFPKRRRAA